MQGARGPEGPEASADSLQSPHDPDMLPATRGRGTRCAETCLEENATQLITHVEVTPSSGSDTDMSVPVVDGLSSDPSSSSTRLVGLATPSKPRATELEPWRGQRRTRTKESLTDHRRSPPQTSRCLKQATVCPAGHPSIEKYELDAPAGRGPLPGQHLPLAVVLPSEAGPACGGLRPQGGPRYGLGTPMATEECMP